MDSLFIRTEGKCCYHFFFNVHENSFIDCLSLNLFAFSFLYLEKIEKDIEYPSTLNRSTTLKFLRNFGSTFSNLTICFSQQRPDSLTAEFLICLEQYLAEYCLESLKEITLWAIEPNRTAAFPTTGVQFLNIQSVSTNGCYFADNFSFNANFPNLESLKLQSARCTFNIQDWHFPTVKNLHFDCDRHVSGMLHGSSVDLIEMFKRQPQLEKLELNIVYYGFPPNLAKCFNKFLPKLQTLTLDWLVFGVCIPQNFESVHLEHVTDFSIRFNYLPQTIPFTFNRLECFEIHLNVPISKTASAKIIEFISNNKHLKTIHLEGILIDFQQLFQLEHVLSNVEEMSICDLKNVSSDIIERFLTQCQSLRLFRICGIDNITDTLESKISEKIMHRSIMSQKVLEYIFRNIKPIKCKNLD